MPPPLASPPATPGSRHVRRPARRGAPRVRDGAAARSSVFSPRAATATLLSGALVAVIETRVCSDPLHQALRDWALHIAALVASAVATTVILTGICTPTPTERRTLLHLGCLVPLLVTLLHELGQSLWPHAWWTLADTLRDCVMDVAGAWTAWWLLR